jgi:glycosyltransferase involved in cell wall biosynthesis
VEKLNIAIVTELFLPGVSGLITAVRNLAETLSHSGHVVTLFAPESAEAADWSARHRVAFFPLRGFSMPCRIGQRIGIGLGTTQIGAREILRKVDVVHLHSPFLAGLQIARLARIERKPIIVTSHALPENIISASRLPPGIGMLLASAAIWKRMGKGIALANALTSPSCYGASLIENRFQRGAVQVISNGVEDGRDREISIDVAPDQPLRALYVGRLQKEKRVDELLYGLRACVSAKISVSLTILGDGPDRIRLEGISQRLDLGTRVSFLGIVSNLVRDDFYRSSHFLLMASRSELQCCAALEIMAAGHPVVAARAGALEETVPDRYAGRLYTPGRIDELVEILGEFQRDHDSYLKLCRGARSTAALHKLSRTTDAYVQVYRSLL